MADAKISDLPVATEFDNDEFLPFVQALETKKVTKRLLLTAKAFQNIAVVCAAGQFAQIRTVAGSTQFEIDDDGDANMSAIRHISIKNNTTGQHLRMLNTNVGDWLLPGAAGSISLGQLGVTFLEINAGFGTINLTAPNAITISWAPIASVWAGAPPADMGAAIERLALALNAMVPPIFP